MRLLAAAAGRKIRGDTTGMMAIIADGFLALGGVYVKFLQGVLLQLPQMRDWKNERRFDVYENVPPQALESDTLCCREFWTSLYGNTISRTRRYH